MRSIPARAGGGQPGASMSPSRWSRPATYFASMPARPMPALLGREVERHGAHVDILELRVGNAAAAREEDLLSPARIEGLELEAEELHVVEREVVGLGDAAGARLGVEAVGERLAQRQDAAARAALRLEDHDVVPGFGAAAAPRERPARPAPRITMRRGAAAPRQRLRVESETRPRRRPRAAGSPAGRGPSSPAHHGRSARLDRLRPGREFETASMRAHDSSHASRRPSRRARPAAFPNLT